MRKVVLWISMALAAVTLGRHTACGQLTAQDLEAASQGLLLPLAPAAIPTSGTFYSWQSAAPLPFNPCPDCTVYGLPGRSSLLVDDRAVSYGLSRASGTSALQGDPPLDNPPPPDYGCGLWLELHIVGSMAQVTLHNTVSGRSYTVWSSPDLSVPIANWTPEHEPSGQKQYQAEVCHIYSVIGHSVRISE